MAVNEDDILQQVLGTRWGHRMREIPHTFAENRCRHFYILGILVRLVVIGATSPWGSNLDEHFAPQSNEHVQEPEEDDAGDVQDESQLHFHAYCSS